MCKRGWKQYYGIGLDQNKYYTAPWTSKGKNGVPQGTDGTDYFTDEKELIRYAQQLVTAGDAGNADEAVDEKEGPIPQPPQTATAPPRPRSHART